jgi:hypothetical protein
MLFGGHEKYKCNVEPVKHASPPVNFYMAELWVLLVGHRTIEGQFKERGSTRWKRVNRPSLAARHFRKKQLSNQEEKLQGIKSGKIERRRAVFVSAKWFQRSPIVAKPSFSTNCQQMHC